MEAIADFLDYTILAVSSEDVDYPKENLKIYTSSTKSFRSLNTNLLTIDIDLGEVLQDPTVLIYKPNFKDQILFKGYSDATFSFQLFSSPTFDIEQDPEHTIYKRSFTITGFNYRYLRVQIPVQTPIANEAYFEIGVVGIFKTLNDYSGRGEGFSLPVDGAVVFAERLDRSETNRKQITSFSDLPVLEFNLSGNITQSVANRKKIMEVFGAPGKSLVFMRRNNGNSFEVYLIQRVARVSTSESVPGNNGVKRFSMVYETIL